MSAPQSGSGTPAPRLTHRLHSQPLAAPQVQPAPEDDTSTLEAMRQGKPYTAGDPYLDKLRNHALAILQKGNMELDMQRRMAMWKGFLDLRPGPRGRCFIAAPFLCEYVSLGWLLKASSGLGSWLALRKCLVVRSLCVGLVVA